MRIKEKWLRGPLSSRLPQPFDDCSFSTLQSIPNNVKYKILVAGFPRPLWPVVIRNLLASYTRSFEFPVRDSRISAPARDASRGGKARPSNKPRKKVKLGGLKPHLHPAQDPAKGSHLPYPALFILIVLYYNYGIITKITKFIKPQVNQLFKYRGPCAQKVNEPKCW